jgi:hypothetical protein
MSSALTWRIELLAIFKEWHDGHLSLDLKVMRRRGTIPHVAQWYRGRKSARGWRRRW